MKATSIETGFTPAGQLYLRVTSAAGTLIRTTRNPFKFFRMLYGAPEEDAQREMARQDRQPHIYAYDCLVCEGGFDRGHGVSIDGHKFCSSCHDAFEHFEYFRTVQKMEDSDIWTLTENYTREL